MRYKYDNPGPKANKSLLWKTATTTCLEIAAASLKAVSILTTRTCRYLVALLGATVARVG